MIMPVFAHGKTVLLYRVRCFTGARKFLASRLEAGQA
jgi:hypothetical protein